MLAATLTKQQ